MNTNGNLHLVLSKGRDPYSPWTPMQQARAVWVSSMFQRMGRRIHLRGFHYFVVSQSPAPQWPDGTAYLNTHSDWEKLCTAAVWARYQGIGDWSNLIDRRHPEPIDSADYARYEADPYFVHSSFSVDDLTETLSDGMPQFSLNGLGTYHLEVWIEKASMNDILAPIVAQYGATLQPLVGESSLERVSGAIERILDIGKPTRIFYISDFDPSGRQMPVSVARKLEFYARDMGLDIRLNPLALTDEQVRRHQLPGIPTKSADSRAAGFIDQYGDRATELDALEALYPGELARIVGDALSPYVDESILETVRELNETLEGQFADIVARHVDELQPHAEELTALSLEIHEEAETLLDDVEYPVPDLVVDESDDWLLDTLRDYDDQWDAYSAYKEGA